MPSALLHALPRQPARLFRLGMLAVSHRVQSLADATYAISEDSDVENDDNKNNNNKHCTIHRLAAASCPLNTALGLS
jgi:hypothetical protein